ncbi:MAG: virulence RhuM family protein [Arcobacteraceae bacterium]|nr:virulence RhuM family protein [Arcobacteraceae bacterium]
MNEQYISSMVIYSDGELELNVSVENETIWLTQKQIAELFKVTKQNISLHINRIFKDVELQENSVVKFSLTTAKDGKSYNIKHYNLDMIISIGYRVNSITATKFRQWSTSVLKFNCNSFFIFFHRFSDTASSLWHFAFLRKRFFEEISLRKLNCLNEVSFEFLEIYSKNP